MASRGNSQGVAGCLTLLQAWIYEYFPCFRPAADRGPCTEGLPRATTWRVRAEDRSDDRLHALRARLDQITADEVLWLPYGTDPASAVPRTVFAGWVRYRDVLEPYMPARVLRQLGYVQTIPPSIHRPSKAVRPWSAKTYTVQWGDYMAGDSWAQFPILYRVPLSEFQVAADDAGACHPGYLAWYYRYSHPQVLPPLEQRPPAVPVRANSAYWFTRLHHVARDTIGELRHYDEESAARQAAELEQVIKDWHLAQ